VARLLEQKAEAVWCRMADREGVDPQPGSVEEAARLQRHEVQFQAGALPAPDDVAQQGGGEAQGMRAGMDGEALRGAPQPERAGEAAEAQDVVEMAMRKQHLVQPPEAQPRLHDLSLRALAAIDEEAVGALVHEDGRKASFGGRHGGGGAEEGDLEHWGVNRSVAPSIAPRRPARRGRLVGARLRRAQMRPDLADLGEQPFQRRRDALEGDLAALLGAGAPDVGIIARRSRRRHLVSFVGHGCAPSSSLSAGVNACGPGKIAA
jgi:hypothetical protein